MAIRDNRQANLIRGGRTIVEIDSIQFSAGGSLIHQVMPRYYLNNMDKLLGSEHQAPAEVFTSKKHYTLEEESPIDEDGCSLH
jgi:hypothetical protein